MTNEIMPREDRMGKILSFIGGCIAGVAGVFAVAVMSEMSDSSPRTVPADDSENGDAHEAMAVSDSSGSSGI